jgi:hypothetical protein
MSGLVFSVASCCVNSRLYTCLPCLYTYQSLQDRRLPFSLPSHPAGTAEMRPARDELQEWDLPHLKDTILLKPHDQYWLYDVKFYPYTPAGTDPIFAIASIRHVIQVCPCLYLAMC